MKKLFGKILAGAISLALVVTLGFGISYTGNVKAANELSISNWTFTQGGVFQDADHDYETGWGNVYFYEDITMQGTNEKLDQWEHPDNPEGCAPQGSTNQSFTAKQSSKGFLMGIKKSGWDRKYGPKGANQDICNPWGFSAKTTAYISPDHRYKVTFKAKAEPLKYGFIGLTTVVGGKEMTPWDGENGNPMDPDAENPKQYFEMDSDEKTITYTFLNAVGGTDLTIDFRLGTFAVNDDGKAYGYGGLTDDISDVVKQTDEKYVGDITISDFTIEDLDPDKPTVKPKPTEPPETEETEGPTVAPKPTQAPTVKPTTAPVKKLGKVSKVKIKNPKKKTIKVSWKKVKNAKSYQVKVGKKIYPAKKNSRKIKDKKFKKGKTVKLKVRAIAKGYKAGPWSKTAKKKLKK